MDRSDRRDFSAYLRTVATVYRGVDVSDALLDVWWAALKRFTLEDVRRGFNAWVGTGSKDHHFWPTPADIVRMIEGSPEDRSAIAWGKTLEAMQSVGAYTDVVFDDPAIHAAVEDLGGWPKLCRTEREDLGYAQTRFLQAHQAYVRQGTFAYTQRLRGDRSSDAEYERIGVKPPLAVVGDHAKARAVYLAGSAQGKVAIGFTTNELAHIAAALPAEQARKLLEGAK